MLSSKTPESLIRIRGRAPAAVTKSSLTNGVLKVQFMGGHVGRTCRDNLLRALTAPEHDERGSGFLLAKWRQIIIDTITRLEAQTTSAHLITSVFNCAMINLAISPQSPASQQIRFSSLY